MTEEDADAVAHRATDLADQLAPFFDALVGKGPDVQGAVLVQLLARYIAGHVVVGSLAQTKRIRELQLELISNAALDLVPVMAHEIGAEP
jgi:hypothetical protein